MQQLFIINPTAGKTDASVVLVPQIQAAAARAGVDVQIEITRSRGHARQLAEAAAASGEEVHIYAAGGDGTMNEVLQGAANHPNIAVGCIPCGSGNDYVRNFGAPADFLDMDAQLAAEAFPVDLLATPQGYGIDIYAAGIDAQVANGIPKWRRIPLCGGTTAYTLSILEAVCSSFRHHLHIQADDRELDGVYMMLAICNARMYGGGYCAAPNASLDDGLLDVVLVKKLSRLRLAKVLGVYQRGGHLHGGQVREDLRDIMQFFRAREVSICPPGGMRPIVNIDGECAPAGGLRARVLPLAASFVLPAPLAPGGTEG